MNAERGQKVTLHHRPSPTSVMTVLASYGLPHIEGRLIEHPLSTSDWEIFLRMVIQQRLIGILTQAISEDAFPVTVEQHEEALDAWRQDATWTLLLEHSLLQVDDLLQNERIPYRVLKGPALAHTVYPRAAARSFEDIDLLVTSDRFDDAVTVLTRDGGVRSKPEPRPGFIRQFGKGAAISRPNNTSIDLHRTLTAGPFGLTIDLDSLFATTTAFTLAGRTFLTLGREELFLHACYHAALGNHSARLLPFRDVVQTAHAPGFDLQRARRLWTDWKAPAVVAAAVNAAWETLGVPGDAPLAAWAAAYRPSRSETRLLSLFRGPEEHDEFRATAAMVGSIKGWRAKLSYLRTQFFPSREYLRSRGESYLSHWLRGAQLFLASGQRRASREFVSHRQRAVSRDDG